MAVLVDHNYKTSWRITNCLPGAYAVCAIPLIALDEAVIFITVKLFEEYV